MRRLKLQVQMSMDGFIAGPNGEMDWMVWDWDAGLKAYVSALTEPVDCILLGRKLAQGFIPYWASHPEEEGAEKLNSTPKVVFTHTLTAAEWEHTTLATGDLVEEVTRLKQLPGQDMIAYGGATFVSALIRHNLIDDYHLLINPVAVGKGRTIFGEVEGTPSLRLVDAHAFACGIVAVRYARQGAE